MSLIRYFKDNNLLKTNIGNFEFVKQLGQGGNGTVLLFKKDEISFAIKFLPHSEIEQKILRFKDEYFCSIQMKEHENIAKLFHYDEIEIENDKFSIIIMKVYQGNLKNFLEHSEKNRIKIAMRVFHSLYNALKHMEKYSIIHRDIKPENIFYDEVNDIFVLADFGIAHFENEYFAKEANETKAKDRMANRLFSAPEQQQGNAQTIKPSADIYSIGQVIYWIFMEKTYTGVNNGLLANEDNNKYIDFINKFLEKALQSEAENRFQSSAEIDEFISRFKEKRKLDFEDTQRLYNFDEIIRATFTNQITESGKKCLQTNEENKIANFIKRLSLDTTNQYWVVWEGGGDLDLGKITEEKNDSNENIWLLNNIYELYIEKLIVYRDNSRLYRSFAILLLKRNDPFKLHRLNGEIINRDNTIGLQSDYARFSKNDLRYIESNEINSGFYYDENGQSVKVNFDKFPNREKNIKPSAILIALKGHAVSCMFDRKPVCDLLDHVIRKEILDENTLNLFLQQTSSYHDGNLTKYD